MLRYFADTSFWIALSSRRDQFHLRARAWHSALAEQRSTIVTTEAVLWEWLNALSGADTRVFAAEAYQHVHSDPQILIVPFEPELIQSAVDLYRERRDKSWSLTDCFSFQVMGRDRLAHALTTDHHFEQAGFEPVLRRQP